MSRKMKDSGVDWIKEVPKEWNVIRVKNKYSSKKRIVGDEANQYERLALTMQGVLKRSKQDSNGLQPEKFEGYQILERDELVFKLIDLENISTSRVGLSPYTGIVSPAYITLTNSVETKYGYYYFISMYYQDIFNKLGGDGVRSNLNAKDLLNIPYLDINKAEKNLIVTYLDIWLSKIDTIIQKQTQLIEEYKIYKQSLITEIVTKGLNPNVEMKDSGIEWIGMVPKHWEIGIVKRWMNKITDGAHISPDTENGIYDFVSVTDIKEEVINFEQALKTSQDSYEYLVRTGCKPIINDVLLSKDGTIGKSVVINQDYEFVVASSLIIFRPDNRICSEYLNYLFKSDIIQKQLEGYLKGTGLKRVSISNASKMIGVLPPREEQRLISIFLDEKISKVNNIIKQKQTLIKELETYKKSLIYECVTGKREIPTIPASIDELIHPAYQEIAITKEGANHNE